MVYLAREWCRGHNWISNDGTLLYQDHWLVAENRKQDQEICSFHLNSKSSKEKENDE